MRARDRAAIKRAAAPGGLGLCARRPILLAVLAGLAASCSNGADDARRSDARARLPLTERLASADPDDGKGLFRQCAACHAIARGGGDRNGPNLYGIVGRPVAAGSERFGYTAGLKAIGGTWTPERLDAWIENPQRVAPGTSMVYAGMRNGVDRADLIAFLSQHGDALADAR